MVDEEGDRGSWRVTNFIERDFASSFPKDVKLHVEVILSHPISLTWGCRGRRPTKEAAASPQRWHTTSPLLFLPAMTSLCGPVGSNTQPTIQSPTSGLQTRTVEARQSQDSQSSSSREALRRLRPEGVVTDALSSDVCALRDSAKAHPLRGPSHPCPRPQSLSLEEKGDLGDTRYCLWGGLSVSRTASSAELVSTSKVRRAHPPAHVHQHPSLPSLGPLEPT